MSYCRTAEQVHWPAVQPSLLQNYDAGYVRRCSNRSRAPGGVNDFVKPPCPGFQGNEPSKVWLRVSPTGKEGPGMVEEVHG